MRLLVLAALIAAGLCLASPAAFADVVGTPPPPPPPPPGAEDAIDPLLLTAIACAVIGLVLLLLWYVTPTRRIPDSLTP